MVSTMNSRAMARSRIAALLNRRASAAHNSAGFTLVELMISLVLLAILLGMGVPSFQTLIAEQRLRAVSSDLRIALNTARSEAVKRNRDVVLSPSGSGWAGGWSIASPEAGDPDLLDHPEAGGVNITGPANVSFSPLGRASIADFEIAIAADTSTGLCLHMEIDGRATATKGTCP